MAPSSRGRGTSSERPALRSTRHGGLARLRQAAKSGRKRKRPDEAGASPRGSPADDPGVAATTGVGTSAESVDAGFLQRLFGQIHEHVRAAQGEPLNALVVKLLGEQAIAAASRGALEWASVAGRRVCRCLDDGRGPPFAPLDRVATALVDVLQLGHEGRGSTVERADAIVKCRAAAKLSCRYSCLTGLATQLDWGGGLSPCLGLQLAVFHDCRLTASDAVMLLKCSPRLRTLAFVGEDIAGIAEEEVHPEVRELRNLHILHCNLSAQDAAWALSLAAAGLRIAHLQSLPLRGLRLKTVLESLVDLRAIDCDLCREDAVRLVAACPVLESLKLCGNPLVDCTDASDAGDGHEGGFARAAWPQLPRLQSADFQLCELSAADQEELQACLPANCRSQWSTPWTLLRGEASLAEGGAAEASGGMATARPVGGRHVVFDSSSSSEDE